MITKNPKEIEILRAGGSILAAVLNLVASEAKAGVSAFELDQLAEKEIIKAGGRPSFKNYQSRPGDPPFPSSLCVSVNDEVVHGIAHKNKILKDGDIVGLDLGVDYQGYFTDAAKTVLVGNVDDQARRLVQTAEKSLGAAIKIIKAGVRTGDVGHVIEQVVTANRFSVVRDLVGHGVGLAVHEDPEIPCFGKPNTGVELKEGMVIAVEPMVNEGGFQIFFDDDKWTIKTADGMRSAHVEHTLLVTKQGCEILTQV